MRLSTLLALAFVATTIILPPATAEQARLLRQPTLSADHIAFVYASDIWIVDRAGGAARRLTSTQAVETNPHFSPDGSQVAFSSNRSGDQAVYVLPIRGGTPERLTWHPAGAASRGWTPDGTRVLYASSRGTAPSGYNRLWTVSVNGGPSTMLPAPWGYDGSLAPDGSSLIVDRVSRWDQEWRHYRGGQNTALTVLDLDDLSETFLPHDRTTDIQPLWIDDTVYFLSDRSWTMNVFSVRPGAAGADVAQLTDYDGADIKWLDGHDGTLVFERDGYLHLMSAGTGSGPSSPTQVEITIDGDFPWMEPQWEDVGDRARSAAISPSGQRAIFEARGEIFTVPVEHGDTRNLTKSSGVADRAPVWSPDGDEVAWFSDPGDGYRLLLGSQDGLGDVRSFPLGESKMVWEPTWSPDGKHIAFVDDDVRVRVFAVESGQIKTVDIGGTNLERGGMGLVWSPDSQWLAYSKTHPNNLRRVVVWSLEDGLNRVITDAMADAAAPAWDRGGKYIYFLASTELALGSGWANTSSMESDPRYAPYLVLLGKDAATPFEPRSDEESGPDSEDDSEEDAEDNGEDESEDDDTDSGSAKTAKKSKKGDSKTADSRGGKSDDNAGPDGEDDKEVKVAIDFAGIQQRVVPLGMPTSRYFSTVAGPADSVFILEGQPDGPPVLHKFSLEEREASEFVVGARQVSVSADGSKLLYRGGGGWSVVGTASKPSPGGGKGGAKGGGSLDLDLQMKLDRTAEWRQLFDEAWRYQRDFFYDPNMHGRDWDEVKTRYQPLVEHVRHRSDLNYLLDQVNGELSVGHSFVFGGDMPDGPSSRAGLLGADLVADDGRWKISRIYTYESWNPNLKAPLQRPGLKVEVGEYILAIDGVELTASDDPYRLLDGTAGRQTVLHVSDGTTMEGATKIIVEPIRSENGLRRRAWVEDNRRRVEELSGGRLAYIWVPNTGGQGVGSFNRYLFAQQDKDGAVIDERFNGGGLLDDYMVDLMTRKPRAGITNEVPEGAPIRLPAGILGPKALLINEMAGSGGDFFPWVFRQQKAGPLIGKRTWGGLVKSSVHYPMIDGGALTAPDNAVFDPVKGEWVGENKGIAPDIEVYQDAKSINAGGDPQLERAVTVLLEELEANPPMQVVPPKFPTPAIPPQ